MKIAEIGGGRPAGVVEVPDPVVADNYAKVKVISAPLCTEFKALDRPRRDGFGHEAAGEVVEIGPRVTSIAVGDRVVVMPANGCGVCDLCKSGEHIYCQSPREALKICGSQTGRQTVAQYVIQQDWLLLKIPAGMSYDHASMACCGFGPGFNAVRSMKVSDGDTVLVSGLGPVGLGAMLAAQYRGARVIGLDVNAYRRDLARVLGAQAVFDPQAANIKDLVVAEMPGGAGVHQCIHTTRLDAAAFLLMELVRRRGSVAFIGQGGKIEIPMIVGKGLTLYGCWHWNHSRHAAEMLAMITGLAERIDQLITHTFPIGQAAEALALQVSGQCGKVVIKPWE